MRGTILICLISFALISALPVTKHKTEEKPPEPNIENPSELKNIVEYERYLNEVIQALESDPEFKKKLDKAPEADIRDGKIAQELDYVNHNVRTKLDEIKRQEIDRLRHLASKQYELSNHIDREHLKIPQHLDHENEHTFEIEDLRKLILKTSEDLAEADRKRREEFKNYEMQKEFEKQQKMKGMDEERRKKYEHELVEKQKKHNQHEKVHHPGSKAQLEEVWEKQDEMDKGDFDPKIFFKMHDLDENGFWDEAEVKALFVKELDKVYEAGVPEDDMRERAEEMENMREHVFRETDTNRDNLISYDEFINQTKSKEFNSDPGWDTIDNSTPYSQTEYKQFEMEREREIKQLIEQGKLPPQPIPHDGYYNYDAAHPGYQQNVQFMPNQHPPMSNEISRDAIQHQQQQQQQQEQQYLHQQQYMQQQQLHGQGHYPQQQPMMPQQQVPPGYQQQIPQHLPQQIPVNHDPHQQMHVPQLHQTQGNVQPQQQQVPQVPQQQQQQQQVPQFPQQQQQQQVPQFPQQQQQQYVPPQQLPQQQQAQQAAQTNPQLVVPQNVPQLPQPNIQQPVNLVPAAAQPLASEQNNIPQIKTNHV